jgi:hypothetical protein
MKQAEWTQKVKPVFLVGCSRSGTTWLQSMLAFHPEIYTGPEPHFFIAFSASEPTYHFPFENHRIGMAEYWSTEDYYGWIAAGYRMFLSGLPQPRTTPRYFLDKTPNQCLHADFILRTFPHARFLDLIRDSRAVVASLLRASRQIRNGSSAMTAGRAAELWVRLVKAGRKIQSMVPSNQYYELKYENLRRNPGTEISKIFEWLDLPADSDFVQSAVEAHQLERVRDSENPFVSIPMTDRNSGITQKKAYPSYFVGPAPCDARNVQLTRFERLRVERIAGILLTELGYTDVRKLSILERILVSEQVRIWLKLPQI